MKMLSEGWVSKFLIYCNITLLNWNPWSSEPRALKQKRTSLEIVLKQQQQNLCEVNNALLLLLLIWIDLAVYNFEKNGIIERDKIQYKYNNLFASIRGPTQKW